MAASDDIKALQKIVRAQCEAIDKLVRLISGETPIAPRCGAERTEPVESPARRALRERIRTQIANDPLV